MSEIYSDYKKFEIGKILFVSETLRKKCFECLYFIECTIECIWFSSIQLTLYEFVV